MVRIHPGLIVLVAVIVLGVAYIRPPVATAPPHKLTQKKVEVTPVVVPAVPEFMFPQGDRTLFPAYRLVALYGSPGMTALGALGKQDAAASIERVKALAAEYQTYTAEKVYPAFEIIATVAAGSPTADGDYSQERDPAIFAPWVAAAKEAGVYIILDLQPGREDFLHQAFQYESLLKEPHVGLALDPEWRLKADQVHLKQIGSVEIAEVNAVADWLATLTRDNNLPQKVFLLHQFKLPMLPNRDQLDTTHPELAYLIQMDGQGGQPAKLGTWRTIMANPPANTYFGWKNFYEKDTPMLTPHQTMQLDPQPWYISYQ